MTNIRDDGPALLDKIQADLQMDDEWVVREPRALTWWAEAIPLRFTVDEPVVVDGDPTIRITVSATVLTDVAADEPKVLAYLDAVNRFASSSAFVWLPAERRIDAFLAHYHYDGIESITELVSAYTLLLYGEVLGRAAALTEQLGGTPGVAAHPNSGTREDFDEMLTYVESQVVPAGAQPNRWFGPELEGLARHVTDTGFAISTGSEIGLTAEFPLAPERNFAADPLSSQFSMPTALLQLGCEDHPTYGAGLVSALRFPVRAGDGAAEMANDLNLAEYQHPIGIPTFGAWCADNGGLAHTSFVPNALYRDWTAPNLVGWSGSRTRWAFGVLAQDI